jgi:outer membrane protein assembly factor BamB
MSKRAMTLVLLGLCLPSLLKSQEDKPFGEIAKANANSTLNMHLLPEGEFAVGKDQWGEIVRVNMLKIKDWSKVPGVKKAWVMKGFEGQEGMAFHPVISEIKDVDGDGKLDIFRCRSELEGARIERLRYDDGSVVWESEPLAALHGDESRLPVFDLDGDGVYSVLHATKGGTWCLNANTGKTEWAVKNALGDIIVGHFLDKKKQAVMVRSDGTLRCYDDKGQLKWTHETGLKGDSAYAHEALRHDVDGDGLDEIFVNWQKLTMALKGDGTILWEDKTQRHHSDYVVCADVDADGKTEFIYDHEGCAAEKGPAYMVDPMTGTVKYKIDYRKDGLRHAQKLVVGDFVAGSKGLEIAMCSKNGNLHVWDATGKLLWKRHVPSSLLSKGDWDGDGAEDIACFALGANVDGIFSVWNGKGERLYAISFLPSPSKRTWNDKNNGGSWSHAMPGGHEGVRRQIDLDGNGRADFIMPFGAWHWGSDSILFLMEGQPKR